MSNTKSSTTPIQKNEEHVASKTVGNLLKLFQSKTPDFSNYYNFEMNKASSTPDPEKKALLSKLKQKLRDRREKKKKELNTTSNNSPTKNIVNKSPKSPTTPITKQQRIDKAPISVNSTKSLESLEDDDNFLTQLTKEETLEEKPKTSEISTDLPQFLPLGDSSDEEEEEMSWKNVPWITRPYKNKNPAILLQEEIIDFYEFIKETSLERETRQKVIAKVNMLVKQVDPNAKLTLFGSYPSELMLPGSDIDFCVDPEKYDDQLEFLRKFADVVKKSGIAEPSSLELISHSKVPIVKFMERSTGQWCDISVRNNGGPAVKVVKEYSEKYPAFKYLILLLKYFLRQRGLNEVYTGGISSYTISLMLISHLQVSEEMNQGLIR